MVVKVEKNHSPKVGKANQDKLTKLSLATSDSYSKLKKIVPAISEKENISKLDVVLEAISYIQRLKNDLESGATSLPMTSLSVTSTSEVPSPTAKQVHSSSRQC